MKLDKRFDFIAGTFSTKSELDQNIVRLLYHIRSGTEVFSSNGELGHDISIAFIPPPEKYAVEDKVKDGYGNSLGYIPTGLGLTPRQIRYYFMSYNPPEKRKSEYLFLDEIRDFVIKTKLVSRSFFRDIEGTLTKEKLNKHLTDMIHRGIISKNVLKMEYFLARGAYSDMSTFPYFKDLISRTEGDMANSNYYCSLLYPVSRTSLLSKNHKKDSTISKLKLNEFEEELFKEVGEFQKNIKEKFIGKFGLPGETSKETCIRLGLFYGMNDVFDALPVIIFDPMPERIIMSGWNGLIEHQPNCDRTDTEEEV